MKATPARLKPATAAGKKKLRPAAPAPVETAVAAPLTAGQIQQLRQTFAVVAAQADIAALVFYRNLFALDPSLRSLFHSRIESQGRKLMEALEFTLATLEKPAELLPVLTAMGRRHVAYGTREEHYDTTLEAMLLTLRETLGAAFTPDIETAWRLALRFVSDTMIAGAREVQALRQLPATPPPVTRRRAAKR